MYSPPSTVTSSQDRHLQQGDPGLDQCPALTREGILIEIHRGLATSHPHGQEFPSSTHLLQYGCARRPHRPAPVRDRERGSPARRPKFRDTVAPDEAEEFVEVIRRGAITSENPPITRHVFRKPCLGGAVAHRAWLLRCGPSPGVAPAKQAAPVAPKIGPQDRPHWSGRRDSNPRPPAPKAGALPGCATPRRCREHRPRRQAAVLSRHTMRPWTCSTASSSSSVR